MFSQRSSISDLPFGSKQSKKDSFADRKTGKQSNRLSVTKGGLRLSADSDLRQSQTSLNSSSAKRNSFNPFSDSNNALSSKAKISSLNTNVSLQHRPSTNSRDTPFGSVGQRTGSLHNTPSKNNFTSTRSNAVFLRSSLGSLTTSRLTAKKSPDNVRSSAKVGLVNKGSSSKPTSFKETRKSNSDSKKHSKNDTARTSSTRVSGETNRNDETNNNNNANAPVTLVPESDRQELRKKLELIVQLEAQRRKLQEQKKEHLAKLHSYRPILGQTLETLEEACNLKRIVHEKVLIARVPKAQHRRPTLSTVYLAITNVLGKAASDAVKQRIKESRKSKRTSTTKRQITLSLIPVKTLRKVRRDKKPTTTTRQNSQSVDRPSVGRGGGGRKRKYSQDATSDQVSTENPQQPAAPKKLKYTRRTKKD